jgi:aminopeptidase YwaD
MRRFIILLWLLAVVSSCGPRFEKEITTDEIESHIAFLASDEMKGRYPGTEEDHVLTRYIASQLKREGLLLYERDGLQPFDVVTDVEAGPGNALSFGGTELDPGSDFRPFPFSADGSAEGEVIFTGYGFRITGDSLRRDDYAPVDVTGKLVMLLRGAPGNGEGSSPYVNYSEDRGKALLASDLGAAGVILVSGPSFDQEDALVELGGKQAPVPVPVIHMRRAAADRFLVSAGADSVSILESRSMAGGGPVSFATGARINMTADLQPHTVKTANVIARLRGSDPVLRSQYVLLGAHHDHLGMGGPGSPSRRPDTTAVHPGADDNASGVAGVLEISEYLVSRSPSRSMLFLTFGAEEMGLMGSRYFTEHPTVDLSGVQAMINLDMVGRLNADRQLQVGGIGTSPVFRTILDSLNREYGFSLKYSEEGYGPSDHASFYAGDIPVLFISTGAHPDYHTPADKAEKINLEGCREVYMFAADIAEDLANRADKIAFTEAGPKVRIARHGREGKITLGLMPDVTYGGNRGMPVMFVTEGRPAAIGGKQKGDTITAIEGKHVGNVYDYMNRLDRLKEDMVVVVTVKRGEDMLDLFIQL